MERKEHTDPKIVHEELERIRGMHGGKLRPPDVVDEARPKDAPLHPEFTWNDKVAGEKFRLWEARQLIRTVTVIYNEKKVPGYYNVPVATRAEGYYTPVEVLVETPDQFQAALDQLIRKFNSAKHSLQELEQIAQHSPYADKLQFISIALAAFAAAGEAVRRIQ